MKKIFHKLLFTYIILIFILLFCISVLSYNLVKSFYIDSLIINLNKIANSIKPDITKFLKENRYDNLDKYVKQTGKRIDTRITVILKSGKVVADSKKPPEKMENHITRPEIIYAFKKRKTGHSIRFSTTVKAPMLYVAIPMEDNESGSILAVLRVSLFIKNINGFLNILGKNIYLISFILMIIAVFITVIFSKNISKPITDIIKASNKIAKGSFKTRISSSRDDELGKLIKYFNNMAEKIDMSFSELIIQKERLKDIINSIKESLIVINGNGQIETVNTSFKKIFNIDEFKNKYYWEILNDSKIEEIVKSAKKQKIRDTIELEINGRIYLCTSSPMYDEEKTIVVFYDITDRKHMEKYKKELIDNVSHELKTPLTLIQGFVETLADEEKDKTKKKYLEIIKKNSERLINIVTDLSIISKIESKLPDKTDFKKFDFNILVSDTSMLFKERIEKKGLHFDIIIPSKPIIIKGESYLIEQVLINLLDNAYKYTEKGKITVSLSKDREKAIIKIADTGIGIDTNSIKRIFERFYVVNKSRSRQTGGTGLGLSIVKHIVLLHKGYIEVNSKEGRGSEFIITLPLSTE
jgi:two-component system phosphate regulon sensor histidine kinase PhoR